MAQELLFDAMHARKSLTRINMPEDQQKTSRRDFLQRLASLGTAGVITPVVLSACGGGGEAGEGGEAGTAEADFSCTDTSGLTEQQIQQRENANYVDETPQEGKYCDNCQLYVQPEAGEQCGGCQVLAGPIHPQGYCDLWVAAQS